VYEIYHCEDLEAGEGLRVAQISRWTGGNAFDKPVARSNEYADITRLRTPFPTQIDYH